MDKAVELEQKYLAPTYKRGSMVLVSGQGMMLEDSQGNQYLDFVSGLGASCLGHQDPEVQQCLHQAPLIHVSNLYHTRPHAELAEKLCRQSFADRVFFCNSGTEATEGSLKFARKWTGRPEWITFSRGFHGRSMGSLSVTAGDKRRIPFAPLVPGVHWAEFNHLESVKNLISDQTAAIIVEPVQGEGGIHPAKADFLQGLRRLCDEHGAALIFDEVQCGLARTGHLWAHQFSGVTPDLMTLAKPLGAGLPIGCVMMTEAVASALEPGDHGSTFAGGPLVTSVANVVFDRVSQPEFLAEIRAKGELFHQLLKPLEQLEIVSEVRGRGLMWGVELIEEVEAKQVAAEFTQHSVLMATAGCNTVRMLPPFIVTREQIEKVCGLLHQLLQAVKPAPA